MQRGRKSGGEAPSRERGAEAQVRGPARRARLPARARPFGSVPSGSWRPGCACLQPPSGRGQSPLFGGQVWLPSLNCRADARVARVTASQLPVPSQSSQSGQCPPRSLSSGHEGRHPSARRLWSQPGLARARLCLPRPLPLHLFSAYPPPVPGPPQPLSVPATQRPLPRVREARRERGARPGPPCAQLPPRAVSSHLARLSLSAPM